MNEQELKKLIEKGESRNLEFKESLSLKNEIGESVSGFANSCDGIILIGVSDLGEVNGVEIGKRTIESLANFIKQNTDNSIYTDISLEKIEGKSIIVMRIKESDEKPVFFNSRAYIRVGKSNHKLSASEIRKLAKESVKSYWDEQICERAGLGDIDWDFVKREFITLYEKISEGKVERESRELLKLLGCIKDNKPTNAGILLFGREPQKFFMNSYIALARYRGDVESSERLDYKEFNGNLFQQIDNCNKYIRDHIAVMSRLEPGKVRREDIPEYGFFSIRELVTNAVCHRDYFDQGSKVIIKMFDNRIDYYNPGGLLKNITPRNILSEQYSRNPIIAKVLSKVKYIEELGEGWNKIIREHKKHFLKPTMPKINSEEHSILISLFSTKGKFEEKKEKLILNERQKKAIDFLKEHGTITNKDYRKLNPGIADKTVFRDLLDLVVKKMIKSRGEKKGRYYEL